MDDLNISKNLQAFDSLPEEIKNWLLSDQVTYTIVSLNRRLGIEADLLSILPRQIGLLAIGNLRPESMSEELSDYLNLLPEKLSWLLIEIKEKILRPITNQLISRGIDINKIGTPVTMKQEQAAASAAGYGEPKQELGSGNLPTGQAGYGTESQSSQPIQSIKPFVPSVPQQQKQFVRKEITNEGAASAAGYGEPKQGTTEVEKFRPDRNDVLRQAQEINKEETPHPKPFILHEERPVAPPQVPPPAPPIRQAPPVPKPSFDSKQEVRIPIKREGGRG